MLEVDMLIAKDQDLLLYEDIDNLIEEFSSSSFDKSTPVKSEQVNQSRGQNRARVRTLDS
jgi:hypothetical protein